MQKSTKNLTAKQEAFARAVASGEYSSVVDAYRIAYAAENMNQGTAYAHASKLAAQDKIATRIAELRDRGARKAVFSLADHLSELDRLKRIAEKDGTHGAAVRAEELRGKVAGFYVEKHEDVTPEREMTQAEMAKALCETIDGSPDLRQAILDHIVNRGYLGEHRARETGTVMQQEGGRA